MIPWGEQVPGWGGTPLWDRTWGLTPPDERVSWPEGHPLPLPKWGRPKDIFVVDSVEQYEELAATVELTVQQLIQAHNYNTIGNFMR